MGRFPFWVIWACFWVSMDIGVNIWFFNLSGVLPGRKRKKRAKS
jgi:hypothetical protein